MWIKIFLMWITPAWAFRSTKGRRKLRCFLLRSVVLLSALAGVVFFTGVAAVAGDLRRARVRAEPVPLLGGRVVRRSVARLFSLSLVLVLRACVLPDRTGSLSCYFFVCLILLRSNIMTESWLDFNCNIFSLLRCSGSRYSKFEKDQINKI